MFTKRERSVSRNRIELTLAKPFCVQCNLMRPLYVYKQNGEKFTWDDRLCIRRPLNILTGLSVGYFKSGAKCRSTLARTHTLSSLCIILVCYYYIYSSFPLISVVISIFKIAKPQMFSIRIYGNRFANQTHTHTHLIFFPPLSLGVADLGERQFYYSNLQLIN